MSTLVDVRGIGTDRLLRARITRQMAVALQRLGAKPATARVAFVDDSGPKGGGHRCLLTVRIPRRPPLRVERTARTPRLAYDGAFTSLERQLVASRDEARKRQRRPRKYFAAKRLLASDLGPGAAMSQA